MGQLIEGQWHKHDQGMTNKQGAFVRRPTSFRGSVTADGKPGPDGRSFLAARQRYHLVVSYACPWAHRALLARTLCGLTDVVGLTVVEPVMGEDGWAFLGHASLTTEGAQADNTLQKHFLREWYTAADPTYTGRVSVPVLWDAETHTIVNNESADLMRMFDGGFGALASHARTLVPAHLKERIDAQNELLHARINNGVYQCGFATSQQAYNDAYAMLFDALDEIDAQLATSPYLLGDKPTESDWRLFTTLIRFDAVYVSLFRCNRQRIVDYKHLWPYLKRLFHTPGVKETVHFCHIKRHYYISHPKLNPSGLVPQGPLLSFD